MTGATGVIEVPAFGECRFPELANTPSPHRKEDALLVEGLRALAPDIARTGVGVLIEPLATSLHAVRMSGVRPGDGAVVIGAGTIGLGVVQSINIRQGRAEW